MRSQANIVVVNGKPLERKRKRNEADAEFRPQAMERKAKRQRVEKTSDSIESSMPTFDKVKNIFTILINQCKSLTIENDELRARLNSLINPFRMATLEKAQRLFHGMKQQSQSLVAQNAVLLAQLRLKANHEKMPTLARATSLFAAFSEKRDVLMEENAALIKQIEQFDTAQILQTLGPVMSDGTQSSPIVIDEIDAFLDPSLRSSFTLPEISDAGHSFVDDVYIKPDPADDMPGLSY